MVELVGWPVKSTGGKLVAPNSLNSEVARSIRDKWVSGDIFWRKMTKAAHTALVERLDERREEAGGQPLKRRFCA